MDGAKWRRLRVKLTPTFTSGKMKTMFHTVAECSENMVKALVNIVEKNPTIDIKEIAGCYTTDVIGSCAFGIDCNSFKDPDAEFRRNGRELFTTNIVGGLKRFLTFAAPQFCYYIGTYYWYTLYCTRS